MLGGGWKVFFGGRSDDFAFKHRLHAGRLPAIWLNPQPPTFEPLPSPLSPLLREIREGKGKKVWSSSAPCRDCRKGGRGAAEGDIVMFCPFFFPSDFFFELLTPEPPNQQAEEGKPGGNSLTFKSPNPLYHTISSFLHGYYEFEKGGGEDQKQNPPTIFGSEREGRRTIKLAVKLQKLHPPADGKGGARKC